MGRSSFDWVVIFDDGTSKVIERQTTPMGVLNYIVDNMEDINIDNIVSIIRLELSW